MYTTGRRFLAIQYTMVNGAATHVTIYISPENDRKFYYLELFAENIALCTARLSGKFLPFVRVAFLLRNLVRIRFRVRVRENVSPCARKCVGRRRLHIILGKVNFHIPGRTRDRAIRIAECIRDVRSSVRPEFSYDL